MVNAAEKHGLRSISAWLARLILAAISFPRRDERLAREAIRTDAERMARVQAGRRG